MNQVNLIVSTHNNPTLLEACLNALTAMDFKDYRLIVVDDASERPVVNIVRQTHPGATVIRSRSNVGLVRCLNVAIDSGNSPYVVLLNDDTEVDPAWLTELVSCADRHPEAGSIASKLMLFPKDCHRIHSAGDFFSVQGRAGNRGVWLEDVGQYDREEYIFSACGGGALYRREALDTVRLSNEDIFDGRLFMYCEDVDIGWRLQLAGYSCVFAPNAVVYHHLSATGGGSLASYYASRNIWGILAHPAIRPVMRPYWPRIVAYQAGRIVRDLLHGKETAARASLRGTAAGIMQSMLQYKSTTEPAEEVQRRIRELLIDPVKR